MFDIEIGPAGGACGESITIRETSHEQGMCPTWLIRYEVRALLTTRREKD